MARNDAPGNPAGRLLTPNGHSAAIPIPICPAPPPGLSPRHRRTWTEYWSSPQARRLESTDVPALGRLWQLRNQYDRLIAKAGKNQMVTGSEGQPVSHPALRRAEALLGPLTRLETKFDLNPRSRRASAAADDHSTGPTLAAMLDDLDREEFENPPDPLDDRRLNHMLGFNPRENLGDPRLHQLLGYDPRDGLDHLADWRRFHDPRHGVMTTWSPWRPDETD